MQSRLGEVPPDGYLFVRFEFDDGTTQTVRAEERPERDGTVDVACTTPTARALALHASNYWLATRDTARVC